MPVDPSAIVAPTARVHPDAVIGPQCVIGDFCLIEQDVMLGPGCQLEPYVFIKRWTTLGARNEISAHTVLGTDPLDKNFRGDRSYLILGDENKVREHYTISRGTQPESVTRIGSGNYVMTSGHIAHNCVIGSNVVIASCTLVAGHVEVGDGAFLSGGVVVHQHSQIGRLAMVAGNTRVNLDLPPFFLYAGYNAAPNGLNLVGLRRAGWSAAEVARVKTAYRLLYRSGLKLDQALRRIESDAPSPNTAELVAFVRSSKRGITRERQRTKAARELVSSGP